MRSGISCLIILLFVAVSFAGESPGPSSPQKEKCPVCGMFVSMFADWNATIEFADSTRAVFDGPKCMFKYYLNMKRYNQSKSRADISAIYVKDYYSREPIDARKAFFVIWSQVYGPMGHEPIPFETKADAKEFFKKQKGGKILGFTDINNKLLLSLDNP
jgi:nitrous oxide reductase accessory protein NosL